MTTSNAQSLRELYDAFAARDLNAILQRVDPAIWVHQTEQLPWGGTYQGIEGLQRFFGNLLDTISSRVEVEEVFEAGDRAVVIGWTRGTVNGTGARFDVRIVHLWTMRDGRGVRFEPFIDTPAMLAVLDAR